MSIQMSGSSGTLLVVKMETERECWHRGTSMSSKLCQSGLDDAERDRAATVGRCSGGSTGVTCQHSPH